jgi:hypothetical protein
MINRIEYTQPLIEVRAIIKPLVNGNFEILINEKMSETDKEKVRRSADKHIKDLKWSGSAKKMAEAGQSSYLPFPDADIWEEETTT